MTIQLDPKSLSWEEITQQIRYNPSPKVRQEVTREAMERVWNGPDQPPDRINPALFEPDW